MPVLDRYTYLTIAEGTIEPGPRVARGEIT